MKLELILRNKDGLNVGTLLLEGPLDESIVKELFDLIMEVANKYLESSEL